MTIDFEKMGGLVPAIVQDADTRQVLMLGFMNREAYEKTCETGHVTFWSRTRNCLWTKGETSGHFLNLVSMKIDCDNDTLLVRVHPVGPTCHKGTDTCWAEENTPVLQGLPLQNQGELPLQQAQSVLPLQDQGEQASPLAFLSELQDYIDRRHEEMPEGSYTTSLFKKGVSRIAQKVGEEALETVIEAVSGTGDKLKYEAADMLYHLIVLLTAKGMRIEDVVEELHRRHDPSWDADRRKAKAEGRMK